MIGYPLEIPATAEAFNEQGYLAANPDVAAAVQRGEMPSARYHFDRFGQREQRRMRIAPSPAFHAAKARKLARIAPLLRTDLPHTVNDRFFDFLNDALLAECGIDDLGPQSSNNYDPYVLELFERHTSGLVLDVGAGRRHTYLDNVVNLEIAPFETTDVRGVSEELPFIDASFDAVTCIAVLEHIRDPFRGAAEIVRVLKPGGELICAVPFLQPLHGYPHHYYNMTHEGLRNLFDRQLVIDRIATSDNTLPIWSIAWILRSWADGLSGSTLAEFLDLRVRDVIGDPNTYLDRPWVRDLSPQKNLELASACVLFARKPTQPGELKVTNGHELQAVGMHEQRRRSPD